jgi:hypothetical protein
MNEIEKISKNYIVRERSNYQLKNFVIGQFDTVEMQYRQIIIEAKDLLFKIKNAEIFLEITQAKIKKLENSSDPIKILKAKQKKLNMSLTLDTIEAAKMELDYLIELSKNYKHYNLEEIENNQCEYWEKRLSRQAAVDQIASRQNINPGNVQSLLQAGLIKQDSNNEKLQIEDKVE